jgi:putative membrane protein insertion efficiency factor
MKEDFMSKLLIIFVRLYQLMLSPIFGPCCRFYPSCSEYFIEAVRKHGILQGAFLGIKRLGKCHPFHPGGPDPVPEKKVH